MGHAPDVRPEPEAKARAAIELLRALADGSAATTLAGEQRDAARAALEQLTRAFAPRVAEAASLQPQRYGAPVCLRRVVAPRAQLFCLPYAGGRPEAFEKWAARLPGDIELHAFAYPRRSSPKPGVDAYVEAVVENLAARARAPYVLAGHSLGGALAWRITTALRDRGLSMPTLLVVSACPAPQLFGVARARAGGVAPEELLTAISGSTMTASALPSDLVSEFAEDLLLAPTPSTDARPEPVSVPIFAVVGQSDPLLGPEDLEGWAEVSSTSVEVETLPGGHHYWFDEASCDRLIGAVLGRLALALGGAARDLSRAEASSGKTLTSEDG